MKSKILFIKKEQFPEGYITERDYVAQFRQIVIINHIKGNKIKKKKLINTKYKTGDPKKFAHFAFKTFDRNSDKIISFDEFLFSTCFLVQDGQSREDKRRRLEIAFDMFDVNKDGRITRQEMRRVYEALYETCNMNTDGTKRIVTEMFNKYDLDKSGYLDMEEFVSALNDDGLFNFFCG
jgi:Ca2+-binding EF-hand superfamily protein